MDEQRRLRPPDHQYHVGCPECGRVFTLTTVIPSLPWCAHAGAVYSWTDPMNPAWERMIPVDVLAKEVSDAPA